MDEEDPVSPSLAVPGGLSHPQVEEAAHSDFGKTYQETTHRITSQAMWWKLRCTTPPTFPPETTCRNNVPQPNFRGCTLSLY